MKSKSFYRNAIAVVILILYTILFWLLPIGSGDGYWFTVSMLHGVIFGIAFFAALLVWLCSKYEEAP